MNIDVRLIQVNERLAKHKLLAAVADWVQNCSGNLQVDFERVTFTPLDLLSVNFYGEEANCSFFVKR